METLVKYSKDRESIKWDDKFSVGISIIDDEHKEFINIINKAIFVKEHNDNPEEVREVLYEMVKYSHTHFSMEEDYMLKFKFPEYQLHRNEHLNFTESTNISFDILVRSDYQIANEILGFLKQWLVNHIQGTDTKYIDCFKKNGLK